MICVVQRDWAVILLISFIFCWFPLCKRLFFSLGSVSALSAWRCGFGQPRRDEVGPGKKDCKKSHSLARSLHKVKVVWPWKYASVAFVA